MYYEKMVDSSSSNFADVVTVGEHIENGLKLVQIASIDGQTVAKKSQGFSKKKEDEASDLIASAQPQIQDLMASVTYYPYPYIAASQ